MLRKILLLCFLLISFATVFFGQDKHVTDDKYKFALNYPNGLTPLEGKTTIFEYRGTAKKYGTDSLFFLKSVMPIKKLSVEELESFLRDPDTIDGMNRDFLGSMAATFPDITSLQTDFIYFTDHSWLIFLYLSR